MSGTVLTDEEIDEICCECSAYDETVSYNQQTDEWVVNCETCRIGELRR